MESLIEWVTLTHPHPEKNSDWYWILGIVAVAGAVLAFYFGNILFGIFIIIAALTMGLIANRPPQEVEVRVTTRGIEMGNFEYPYATYRSFWIEDDHMHGTRILLHHKSNFIPLHTIPVDDDVDLEHLRDVLNDYLEEEFLKESAIHRLFDRIGV